MEPIAYLHNAFPTKFGLPRQSGLAPALLSTVEFIPAYRVPEALRGLDQFSHLWLLWGFHQLRREAWRPTVRPPRLGGNTRLGVFATRSPYRPNPIGLTVVRLEKIIDTADRGQVLVVSGADMVDGTPIYDIKPYLPYVDCVAEATGGYTEETKEHRLRVEFPPALMARVPEPLRAALPDILARDPRPGYQADETRVYGFLYGVQDVRFTVQGDVLKVVDIAEVTNGGTTDD